MQPAFACARRCALLVPIALFAASGAAQQTPEPVGSTLSLEEALVLARVRNGDVRAAALDAGAARQSVIQSRALLLPTITPSYQYTSARDEVLATGGGTFFSETDRGTSRVNATWRLLDAGERYYSLRSSELNSRAAQQSALQTLRQVLFNVHQQFFDTLRSQELLRVAVSQVQRAKAVLDQTEAQVQVGETARIQLLQAQADHANAVVQQISARNRLITATGLLKATIGWTSAEPLPELEQRPGQSSMPSLPPMEELIAQGIERRADLTAQRERVRAQRFSALRAERESQVSFGVDASFDQQLSPDNLESRALVLNISLPWLDAGRSRAAAKQAQLNYEASRSQYVQTEREARSDIETAYTQVRQNLERVQAAQTAVQAARQNYDAAVDSQRLGASDIVDVITAQTSLVTAESNYVEALYDYEISQIRLRLVTGESIPGEQSQP